MSDITNLSSPSERPNLFWSLLKYLRVARGSRPWFMGKMPMPPLFRSLLKYLRVARASRPWLMGKMPMPPLFRSLLKYLRVARASRPWFMGKMPMPPLFRSLLKYLRPVAGQEIIGIAALLGHSGLSVLIPVFVKQIINQLENHSKGVAIISPIDLVSSCLYILGLSLGAALMLLIARWTIIGAS